MSCSEIACWINNLYLCGLSYVSHLSTCVLQLKLLKLPKNRTKFQSCFSKSQLQKWMAKEPEQQCDTYFLTHKIVSCPQLLLRSTKKHITRSMSYNIVTQSLLRLVYNRGWFGCLGKVLGSILCSFVFEKRSHFWQETETVPVATACSKRNKNVQVIFALQKGKLKNVTCECRCYFVLLDP